MRKKFNTKKFGIGLLVAFTAITTGLTISSKVLNDKVQESILDNVEPSTKAIISTNDESFEETLANESVSYTKIGNTTYIVNYDSSSDAQTAVYQTYADNDNVTTNYDMPFEIAGNNDSTINISNYKPDVIPDDITLRDYADSVEKKVVAVIDTGVSSEYASVSKNFTDESDSDENGHGTEVAKTILDNSDGKAIILSLKALGKDGTGYMSSIMQAVQYAREQHVDVINMSCVGYDYGNTTLFKEQVKNAIADGIKVVAAAGNYNASMIYFLPNSIDGVISVGAIDEEANKVDISNYNANYYEVAETTSQAAAIYSGKFVSGMDMSNEKTESDITYTEDTEQGELMKAVVASGATHIAADSEKKEVKYALDVVKIGEKYYYLYNNEKEFYSEWPIITEEPADYYFTIPKDGETFIASSKYIVSPGNGRRYNVGQIHIRAGQHGQWMMNLDNDIHNLSDMGVTRRGDYDGYFNAAFNDTENYAWGMNCYLYPDSGYTYPDGWGSLQIVGYYDYRTAGLDGWTITIPEFKLNQVTYTVTFKPNDDNTSTAKLDSTSASATVQPGNSWGVYVPNATRKYYNFLGYGWATDNNPNVVNTAAGNWYATFDAGDKTVYAAWRGKYLTVNFDGNGANGNVPGSQGFNFGTNGTLSSMVPTRTGYTFANWNTSRDATAGQSDTDHILYNPGQSTYMKMTWVNKIGDVDNQNVTLFAIWTENSYKITYNLNKGSGSSTPTGDTSTQTQKYTQTVNLHSAPSRTGYIFTGWNTQANGSGNSYKAGEAVSKLNATNGGTVTLYAQWRPIEYNITYNANGGQNVRYNSSTKQDQKISYSSDVEQKVSSAPTASHHVYDVAKNLNSSTSFTWAGHTLLGWSTNPNATTATYTNAQSVKNLVTTDGENLTLYAVWKANSYTLTINPNSGGTWSGTKSSQKGNANTYQDGKGNTKWGDVVTIGDAVADNKSATITYNVNAGDDSSSVLIDKTSDTVKWMFSRWTTSGVTRYLHNNSARANDGSHDNGGTTYFVVHNSNDTITANYYWQTVTLPTPTREGYTFLGWYYDANCTDKVDGRGAGNTKYPLDANGKERESEFRTTGNGGATFRTEGNITIYARWQKNSFDYSDTVQVFMQNDDNATKGVFFRKVNSTTMKPLTEKSAIIGIYKTSISDSNLVLKIDTVKGIYNASGKQLEKATSDTEGWYNITGYLTNGTTYIAHEIEAPQGYSKAKDIRFTYNNTKRTQIQMEDAPFNSLPDDLNLTKYDIYNRGISGAKYTLTDTTTNKLLGTFVSDAEGVIIYDLPSYVTAGHRYYIHEIKAPEGYALSEDIYFTVPNEVVDDINLPTVITEKTINSTKLKIKKIDNDENPLQGAIFQLFMKDENGELIPCYMNKQTGEWANATEESDTVTIMTATTGSDGIATFSNLPIRANYTGSEADYTKSYYLKEIQAPEGKTLLTEIMEIRLPNNGNTEFTYTVTDDSITLTLEAGGNGTLLYTGTGSVILIAFTIMACALKKRKNCLEN